MEKKLKQNNKTDEHEKSKKVQKYELYNDACMSLTNV